MPERNRRALIGFGSATAIFALVTLVFWFKVPHIKPLSAFWQFTALLTLTQPLLYLLTTLDRPRALRVGGLASCILWVLGIILYGVIPPASQYVYLSDSLLLLGFAPLLYLWKYSWPWLVFGFINVGVGILLQVFEYSPDNLFPKDLLAPKHHLGQYHPAASWWFLGTFALAFGFGRLSKNIYLMIQRKRQKPAAPEATDPS